MSTRSIIAMIMQVFSQVSRWKWNGTSKQSSCDIMSLFLICLAARNSSYCFSIATRANSPERQTSVNYKSTAIAHIFFIIIWAKMKQRRLTREVVCARRKSAVWMNIFWWKKGISRPIESEGVVLRWRCRRWRQEVENCAEPYEIATKERRANRNKQTKSVFVPILQIKAHK